MMGYYSMPLYWFFSLLMMVLFVAVIVGAVFFIYRLFVPGGARGGPSLLRTGKRCPNCQNWVETEFKICPICGAQLKSACPSCGRAVEVGWRICPYCGKELKTP